MDERLAGKRVVTIADNATLCGAVQVILTTGLGMNLIEVPPHWVGATAPCEQDPPPDLIVVIQCEYAGDPMLMLSRAGLSRLLGEVPVLIVSGRPSDACPDGRIAHLHFPFGREELEGTVRRLLLAD